MSVEIDNLHIEIESNSEQAASGIDKLAASLEKLRAAAKGGYGLTSLSNQLNKLAAATTGAVGTSKKIAQLTTVLNNLSACKKPTGLLPVANSIQKLSNALQLVSSSNSSNEKIESLVSSLNSLATISKASGLTSTLNALKKLPEISKNLESTDLGKFALQMKQVADSIAPLASEMQKVSNGFAAFPIRIQKIISGNGALVASNKKTAESFGVLGTGISSTHMKMGVYIFALQRVAKIMASWVSESNRYVEDLNLFTVAMGDGAQAAYDYAQAVHDALGIDPAEWMRNQGVFKQIASGFGVVEDKANLMSKNLTQIGYDISSFFNIPIGESMRKVESGIAGELEPLRRLGYALDVATLQEIAYKNGIDMKVSAMTQAQKSQLRYLAIMQQSGNVMGDMARTIMTPANAMRILQQQVTQLKRALGDLLIPVLIKIVPYVQAFVAVLTEAIQALAALVGFELPKIDYSGFEDVASGAGDAESSIDGTTKAAKELKNALLGIDELTIIAPTQGAGGAAGGGGISGGDLGLDLPEYDFLKGINEKTDELKEKMRTLLYDYVIPIGAALLAWKFSDKLVSGLANLFGGLSDVKKLKMTAGITLMIAGFALEAMGAYGLGAGDFSVENVLKSILGSAMGIAGSLLVFGVGPVGWAIGIGTALTVFVTSFTLGWKSKQLEDDIKKRFGEIELSEEEVQEFAKNLTTSELSLRLGVYIDEKVTLESLQGQVEESIKELNKLNFKASLGLEIDQNTYQSAVDSFISNTQSYILQKQIVATMAVDILLGGTEVGDDLSNFAAEFYGGASAKLKELGDQLKSTVSDGFMDGEWIPDKLQEAVRLQKEIQDILDYQASVEFEAKLESLRLDAKGTDLTVESFANVMKQAEDNIQGQLENLKDVRLEALKIAKMEYDQNILNGMSEEAAQQIYSSAVSAADKAFQEKSIELHSTTFSFGMDTLTDAFAEELSIAQPMFTATLDDTISAAFKEFAADGSYVMGDSLDTFLADVRNSFVTGLNELDITPEARKNLEKLLVTLEPTAQDLEELAASALAAGLEVPANISQGLNDINQLKAIAGDTDAILYMIGAKFSTDPQFLETLQTVENAGKSIDEHEAAGLLNNLQLVKDAASGTIIGIQDSVTGKVLELTPIMVQNLKDLGLDLSSGLSQGIKDGELKLGTGLTSWANGIVNKVNKAFEINSPSKPFITIGGYLSDGILAGINGKKDGLFREIGNWSECITNKVKEKFGIHSPSAIFRDQIGMNLGLGVAAGITKSGNAILDATANITDGVQDAFNSIYFRPDLSAIKDMSNISPAAETMNRTMERAQVRASSEESMSGSVSDGNMGVINAIYAVASMIVRAIEEKDMNVELDGERVSRGIRPYSNRLDRREGKSLVRSGNL